MSANRCRMAIHSDQIRWCFLQKQDSSTFSREGASAHPDPKRDESPNEAWTQLLFCRLNPEKIWFYSEKKNPFFPSSVLYPTASSSIDPTVRKPKTSSSFVALGVLA